MLGEVAGAQIAEFADDLAAIADVIEEQEEMKRLSGAD